MKSFVLNLTLFRILAAPFVFICAIFFENYWLAFWLFNLAAITDYFDGKLARDFQVESRIGRILDPIGDKLLVLFGLISVTVFTQDNYIAFMSAFILAREFWVSVLREYSSVYNFSNETAVTFVAKAKTAFQFFAIGLYLYGAAEDLSLIIFLAHFVLFLSVLFAYKSAISYTINLFKKI